MEHAEVAADGRFDHISLELTDGEIETSHLALHKAGCIKAVF